MDLALRITIVIQIEKKFDNQVPQCDSMTCGVIRTTTHLFLRVKMLSASCLWSNTNDVSVDRFCEWTCRVIQSIQSFTIDFVNLLHSKGIRNHKTQKSFGQTSLCMSEDFT